jgi:hypothetical protein
VNRTSASGQGETEGTGEAENFQRAVARVQDENARATREYNRYERSSNSFLSKFLYNSAMRVLFFFFRVK